jgi:hypothetical protein
MAPANSPGAQDATDRKRECPVFGRVHQSGGCMKWMKLIGVAALVTVGVILYIGKDDMIRYRQMRRM